MLLCLVGFSQQYGPVKQLLLQIGAKKGATGKCVYVFLFNLFVCAIFHLLHYVIPQPMPHAIPRPFIHYLYHIYARKM